MTAKLAGAELVRQVLSGEQPELKLLAAQGVLPLPPERLIRLQIRLAMEADTLIAQQATASLQRTEPRLLVDYISAEASGSELSFFASEIEHPLAVEAMLRRRDVPRALLVELASRLEFALQEILILRQDAIIDEPKILEALERNPDLDPAVRRRIREYREHLLPRHTKEAEPEAGSGSRFLDLAGEDQVSEEEVLQAISEAAQEPPEGEKDEITGLTESQIKMLPIPVRMKLSRGASRTLRGILLRDNNTNVAISTIKNNALSDEEVEQVARSRSVVEDVLVEIARRREWTSKYGIISALVTNPRTPLNISVRLVPRLSIRDLRGLSSNRNVPQAVRTIAKNLYSAKTK